MLLGDSVLVQNEKGEIFRPSDVGEPVDIMGAWTLKFNNCAVITTFETSEFRTFKSSTREGYTKLNNLNRNDTLGYREPFIFPDVKWESKINLAEYTNSGEGLFDISATDFAHFAGWFCKSFKLLKAYPDSFFFRKERVGENFNYVKKLGLADVIGESNKGCFIKKCYLTELIDALFDFSGVVSIPDELLFNANAEWFESFKEGLLSGCIYDKFNKVYEMSIDYVPLLSDLILALNKTGTAVNLIYKTVSTVSISFPVKPLFLRILNGYENSVPLTLYDIGKGEFNVSGVIMREV